MIVGDNKRVIYCVLVDFSESLKAACGDIVKFLFIEILKPFWNKQQDIPKDKVMLALQSKSLKKAKVDFDSFDTIYSLW